MVRSFPMTEVRVTVDIDAPSEAVARLVAAFDLAADVHPQIASCHTEGEGVGATRALFLADGQELHERMIAETPLGYTVEGSSPSRNYASWRAQIEVEARGEGSHVVWTLTFEPNPGLDVAELVVQQRGIFEEGLSSVKRQLEGLD